MTRKKKLKISDDVEVRYSNWMAQLIAVMMPWSLYWIAGRASAKTVQVLAERVQEVAQDCPGAPFAWVADTYSDLHKNVVPSLVDGLSKLGWEQGIHYVMNQEPPKEWRDRMYNVCSADFHVPSKSTGKRRSLYRNGSCSNEFRYFQWRWCGWQHSRKFLRQ